MTVLFTARPVTDYRSARTADPARARRWHDGLRARGLLVNPAQQKWYLSTAHGDEEIDRTLDAARAVLEEIADDA